jgi:hypothetical protein
MRRTRRGFGHDPLDTRSVVAHPSSANGDTSMPDAQDPLLCRIRNEFAEMPGLSLTELQAARLWQVDPGTTADVLRQLVEARFLARNGAGLYRRMSVV